MIKFPIYMDNQATTPVDPRVLEAMIPFFTAEFGNPASTSHSFGWRAEETVEKARAEIAALIGADPKEIIITSGATESNNLAIKGVWETYHEKGNHIITQVTEHKAVLDTCKYLEKHGAKITYLPVDSNGRISLGDLNKAITGKTILISIMFANNEIGTIQPIREIGEIAKVNEVLFHVDAAQAAGKVLIDVEKQGIDLLSISGHKMYAPKGIGILYVRSRHPHVRISMMMHGGGHEKGFRSGTLNVPGIVGLAKACEIAGKEMKSEFKRLIELRNKLQSGLEHELDFTYLNGHPTERLPNNLNMSFSYIQAESLLKILSDEIALSSGSACSSAKPEPSHVLKSLGFKNDRAQTSIRFGLGRFTTEEEIDHTIKRVVTVVKQLRAVSPIYKVAKEETVRR